jgi:hypothetical protein
LLWLLILRTLRLKVSSERNLPEKVKDANTSHFANAIAYALLAVFPRSTQVLSRGTVSSTINIKPDINVAVPLQGFYKRVDERKYTTFNRKALSSDSARLREMP